MVIKCSGNNWTFFILGWNWCVCLGVFHSISFTTVFAAVVTIVGFVCKCWSLFKTLGIDSPFTLAFLPLLLAVYLFKRRKFWTHTNIHTNTDPSNPKATVNSLANCVPLRPINVLCAQIFNAKKMKILLRNFSLHLCLQHTNIFHELNGCSLYTETSTIFTFLFLFAKLTNMKTHISRLVLSARLKCIDPLRLYCQTLRNISIFTALMYSKFWIDENELNENEFCRVKMVGKWKTRWYKSIRVAMCRTRPEIESKRIANNDERMTLTTVTKRIPEMKRQEPPSTGKIKFSNILFSWDFCGMHTR